MTISELATVANLQDFVRENERIHAQGNGSKPALRPADPATVLADLSAMSGIVEYQPSEYTLTARAGTTVAALSAALKAQGQYLPFDPLLADCATIGGTVASNLSGSRRFRYGGVRDFILGAEVVDGLGRAFSVGGKVVKNAAGFDLSKFLVGSLGKYAIMTELTFKVFPDVPHFRSLSFGYASLDEALAAVFFINQSVFELDALDFRPAEGAWSLLTRLAGFAETLPQRAERFKANMTRETNPLDVRDLDDSAALWNPVAELKGDYLVKIALSPKQVTAFDALVANVGRRYGVGGNVAWVATDDIMSLDAALKQCRLSGLCLRGKVESAIIGTAIDNVLADRVKQVLDPQNKLV